MDKIILVTTNNRKLKEAKLGCALYNIEVEQANFEFDEIQSSDYKKVAINKGEQAFAKLNKPLVVTDTAWNIPALNGFPGAYMKEVARWLSPKDFLNLIEMYDDKRVCFIETVCFKDARRVKIFSKDYWGKIIKPRSTNGISIEQVAEFDGKTIAEQRDNNKTVHKPKDYIWADFAKWYKTQ